MVSVATIVCIVISLLVSLALPVVVLAVFAVKCKKQGILPAWLLGASGFFVTQILIRLPILTALQSQSWFQSLATNHRILYGFGLAFTAGLFELAGRFVVAKILHKKQLNFNRSLAAGLGHGGIEAMVITGIAMINNLAYVAMINNGTFEEALAITASAGVDVNQFMMIKEQLLTTSPALFLLGGFERILAMTAHVAMSMLVCHGIAHKKVLPCVLVCLGIHTFIDFTAVVTMILPQTAAYIIVYAILIAVAAASLWIIRELRRRWNKEVLL